MSLFSTIAHHEESQTRARLPRSIGMLAVVLGLGIVLGYVISNIDTVDEPVATAERTTNALSEADFYQLNTEGFLPLAASGGAVPVPIDRFTYLNVGSYDGLIQMQEAKAVDPGFWDLNTTSLEYPVGPYADPFTGPR